MNFPGKEFWYDWNGANQWLFQKINGIRAGEYYDNVMIAFSKIADHHLFPYYMLVLAVFALSTYFIRKVKNRGGTPHYLAAWFGILLVLFAGYLAEGYIIGHGKDYFSYPRPYMVLAHDTRVLEHRPEEDNYHSFPSGHTGFIILMVVGLWPVLSPGMKILGAVLIPCVMWSRMVMGVHFPADVTLSFLIFLPLILFLRWFIYRVLRGGFGIKC